MDIHLANGEYKESDVDKRQTVNKFYTDLFTTNPLVNANTIERDQMLSLLTPWISIRDNNKIMAIITLDEITKVVHIFQFNKSLGLDGVTTKMMQSCWDFIQ